MMFGVGAGWNREEMRSHGTDPAKRFGIMRERVEAMQEIWTNDEAEYHGEHVDFDPIYCWPKPLQEGGPPILVGGNGPTVRDRVLAFGDAWYPNRIDDNDALIAQIEALQNRAADEGRGPIPVVLQIPPSDLSILERYENAGVTRAVHMLRAVEPDEVDAQLEKWTARIREYEGAPA
jgi:alkanesulfonate monooxygenase SsuD/methylene tetrahydromethanopterin reductase-like flavin-dependent oxidoreductase (luciferase family)